MKDIVFPKNNEEEFIAIAKRLGMKELLFVYQSPKEKKNTTKKITIKTAIISTPNQLKSGNANASNTIVRSDPDKDRWIIEKIKPKIMFGFEFQDRNDFMHHRNSGINHVTAKLMAKNKITYGFPVADLINSTKQGVILGRMKQNIKLCKKYKVEIILASFASDPMDMRNLKDVKCLVD
ncbi:hypothetical protein COV16_03300 [Candidatus Woesearchaeota archaeon CG10_big_fil_rev_8_21_14_0_10_34_8]|nr:MAG: hypothetical protein COV16_03300 [Candidatus Woesearchaeota archaeon CG10_big_fil_rev_8_21_14_0_10_34_8]